jgi:hypothetical protein
MIRRVTHAFSVLLFLTCVAIGIGQELVPFGMVTCTGSGIAIDSEFPHLGGKEETATHAQDSERVRKDILGSI